ncbi:MAG: pyruvate dehydrogenase (acetyl-transferring), homodimeric type, partial [Candidatus Nanopelagicales bacterium]
GFLLGATAGRTTLNGEGLQHQDGHSLLLASTNPAVVAYDPAFGYEIAHIVKDGLRRMYGENSENVFYYLTVYNEPYAQPAEPDGVDTAGILAGMHVVSPAAADQSSDAVQLLASGVAVPWALKAQQLLRDDWAIESDVWSVTSWNELRRDGLASDRHNLTAPGEERTVPYVRRALEGRTGSVVAVSDYMRAVPDQIQQWIDADYTSLGTDGWGMSDTRAALRRHFLVDAECIVAATLAQLVQKGAMPAHVVPEATDKYDLRSIPTTDLDAPRE